MSSTLSSGAIAQNMYTILTNVFYLVPAMECVRLEKRAYAFVYFSIAVTSTMYHSCKFGSENEAGVEGFCFLLDFDSYFIMDHLFAYLTVPILVLFLTPLDSTSWKTNRFSGSSSSSSSSFGKERTGKKVLAKTERELFDKLFERGITRSDGTGVSFLSAPNPGWEDAYVWLYAYCLGFSLAAGYPDLAFTLSVCGSALLVGTFWWTFYKATNNVIAEFNGFGFVAAAVVGASALSFMIDQEFLSADVYLLSHGTWHVLGPLSHYLLFRSKYRFVCYLTEARMETVKVL
jgi:Protein of unknown function (DUF3522)